MTIAVLLYPGFDELDAVGPFEVLRAAQLQGAPFEVRLASRLAPETIVASHGMEFVVKERLAVATKPDWLVVPGGGWAAQAAVGTWGEVQRGDLPKLLAELNAAGVKFASVCTGSLLLAAAGITKGRPAATHHTAFADLEATGAELVKARVVDDEELVTAGGVTSGIDLALWLVERLAGKELADRGAQRLEYQRQGGLWLRP